MTRAALLLAACAALAACASAPPQLATPRIGPPPGPSAAAVFEHRQRELAETAAREGRLADAVDAWEIVTLLSPDDAVARDRLAALRQDIATATADHLLRGRTAWRRGALDEATAQFVAVLSIAPGDTQATDALRAIDRERNRRALSGKGRKATEDTPAPR